VNEEKFARHQYTFSSTNIFEKRGLWESTFANEILEGSELPTIIPLHTGYRPTNKMAECILCHAVEEKSFPLLIYQEILR